MSEDLVGDVEEVLWDAWQKIEGARGDISFVCNVIENETENAKWTEVGQQLRKIDHAILRLLYLWDKSPIGRHIRDERSERRQDERRNGVGGTVYPYREGPSLRTEVASDYWDDK